MAQSQAASLVNESLRADTIPLLDHTAGEVSTTTLEVSTSGVESQIVADRSPLPFEEIPGPAILKIWEKYWKYVPLFGTQVLSSLLINRFTQGTICWSASRQKSEGPQCFIKELKKTWQTRNLYEKERNETSIRSSDF